MPIIVYVIVFIQLIIITINDIKNKKIKNYWHLINLVIFIIFAVVYSEYYDFSSIDHYVHSIAFFVAGFFLFTLKIMGGGDSKYLTMLFLGIPTLKQHDFFLCLLYTTVLIGSMLLLFNLLSNLNKLREGIRMRDMKEIKSVFGKKFSFAPVIFVSWFWLGVIIYVKS